MDEKRMHELQRIAQKIRLTGLSMVRQVHSGHIGGAFSLAEVMSVLYFDKMHIDPQKPRWEDRDRFVLSKGHATVALYATLALRGFFPVDDLSCFRCIDGYLSGHSEMNKVPGVDMSTGSLGQGFSAALGMAVAGKQLNKDYTVYAVLGDGEIQEGQIWEAAMYAGAHQVDNLVAILDSNKVQLDGTIKEVLDTGNLVAKFESFGFAVFDIDGHDVAAISDALDKAKMEKGKPAIVIANTVKGKGVSFMEGLCQWHGKCPDDAQFDAAFAELDKEMGRLEGLA